MAYERPQDGRKDSRLTAEPMERTWPLPRSHPRKKRPLLLFPALQTALMPPFDYTLSRLYRFLAQPIYRSALYDRTLGGDLKGEALSIAGIDWPEDPAFAERLLASEPLFGTETHQDSRMFGKSGEPSFVSQTYRDSFAWLDSLRAFNRGAAKEKARDLIKSWLRNHSRYESRSWRADILANRLHRLSVNLAFLDLDNDPEFKRRLLLSLRRQATHLARALPDGEIGSALLEGAIALLIVAAILPNAEKIDRKARRLFQRESAIQFLSDGGHIERSPLIMRDLLCRLLDLRAVLTEAQAKIPDNLGVLILHLARIVQSLCHNDGDLAQFNDSSEGNPNLTRRCLSEAGAQAHQAPLELPASGFQRLEGGQSVVIQDCGKPPKSGYDSHAHAGTLSFEFSHEGERIVVNCGAHPYLPDWRNVQRNTAAHSTMIVEDTNSSMLLPLKGRRGGGVAIAPSRVEYRREEKEDSTFLESTHDGYQETFGLVHVRRLLLAANGEELNGEDYLIGDDGRAFALRFHLHPHIQAVVTHNGQAALLKPTRGLGWRLYVQGGDLALADSVYLTEKGHPRRAQQLVVLGLTGKDRTRVAWSFQRESRGK